MPKHFYRDYTYIFDMEKFVKPDEWEDIDFKIDFKSWLDRQPKADIELVKLYADGYSHREISVIKGCSRQEITRAFKDIKDNYKKHFRLS